jgi:hypothetical protein
MFAAAQPVADTSPDLTGGAIPSSAESSADMWPQVRAGLEFLQAPFPAAAVALAEAHRDEVAPHLVAALAALAEDPTPASDATYTLHLFAMHLLAGWRDRRAFAPLLDLGRLPDEELLDSMFGDLSHDSYGRCLASVSGGDVASIMALAEDPLTTFSVRAAVLEALTDCVLEGEADREYVVATLGAAAEREAEALEAGRQLGDKPYELLDALAIFLSNLGAVDWLPAIHQWHAKGLLDPTFADLDTIEQHIVAPVDHALARMRCERRGYVADAATEMSWWAMFNPPTAASPVIANEESRSSTLADRRPAQSSPVRAVPEPVKQVIRDQPRVGRNEPCPCGSGRKFKKCHGAA